MATTPEQFASIGLDIITQWQQDTERLMQFASVYEARGGANQFNNAKRVAPEGGTLSEEDEAYNAELDRLASKALEVVTHHNELMSWLDAGRKVRIALLRTDY